MSESMAFIGGVAVAGLAALLLLKGTNTPIQPNFAVAPQMPATVMQPQPMQQPAQYPPNLGQTVNPNQPQPGPSAEERIEREKLNMQLEQLKNEKQQLILQNQQQQNQIQYLTQQIWSQQNQANARIAAMPAASLPAGQTPWWSSPIVWAVGGMSLTIGGGVVVAGVLSLFSPKQRHTRTVQVIPYTGNTPVLAPARRADYLPHRVEARRVESPEYDEV
ncbi:MAG TPA: heterocyst differentiation related protein [Nostocaceae cyanobacterium]|nr:heterocyst differentiation related protein [Nostocaceae cyanobacterium]